LASTFVIRVRQAESAFWAAPGIDGSVVVPGRCGVDRCGVVAVAAVAAVAAVVAAVAAGLEVEVEVPG